MYCCCSNKSVDNVFQEVLHLLWRRDSGIHIQLRDTAREGLEIVLRVSSLLFIVRNTGNRLFIPRTLSPVREARDCVKWRDGDPYFELYCYWTFMIAFQMYTFIFKKTMTIDAIQSVSARTLLECGNGTGRSWMARWSITWMVLSRLEQKWAVSPMMSCYLWGDQVCGDFL